MSNSTCTPELCANPGPRGGPCKECQKAKALARYYAHRDEMNAYNKAWREANPERNKKRVADWFEANAERRADYIEEHRDERNAKHRKRRAANPGEGTESSRRWREANPEKYAVKNRANGRRRLTGTTYSRLLKAEVLERDGMVCHICKLPILSVSDLNFDHIIPFAKGGLHVAENVAPSHALCNLRKSDKIV